jgi:hypothetical protein
MVDEVEAGGDHTASVRLHLAPGVEVEANGAGRDRRLMRDGRHVATVGGDLGWAVDSSPYHPDFNVEIERRCLVAELSFRDRVKAEWWIRLEGARS